MKFFKVPLLFTLFFLSTILSAQKKAGIITGIVLDENDNPLGKVSISILGREKGTTTNDSGRFVLEVPSGRPVALIFSYTGYKYQQRNFSISGGEQETITIHLEKGENVLEDVTVRDQRGRREAGRVDIDPDKAILNPSPIGNIESLIKVFVGSNNELTSQYNVRGGSYDENLIYVNDFEVFRPYLVRSGQQEGLSFINPEMTGNVRFFNGGFQAKYGDKMSSVLDITYRKPHRTGGSGYIGLLEQGLHLEGASKNERFTYLLGFRHP